MKSDLSSDLQNRLDRIQTVLSQAIEELRVARSTGSSEFNFIDEPLQEVIMSLAQSQTVLSLLGDDIDYITAYGSKKEDYGFS